MPIFKLSYMYLKYKKCDNFWGGGSFLLYFTQIQTHTHVYILKTDTECSLLRCTNDRKLKVQNKKGP